ncbi:MAG: FKBP-type peptidyl-prolyl cis-trans isomerase [Paludibacteraceae bacterium]|nr:FKBP-type peptidyl-prolyl cis-trans isomerase [Paludibacteraceae bacterium]
MKDLSYALGMMVANDFKRGVFKNIDVNEFAEAVKAVFNNEQPRLGADEANQIINTYYQKAQMEAFAENKKVGDAYLAENKKREGVITTASGLQYEIIKEGTGNKPKETDTVRCHYEGRFISGEVFDSSYKHNSPAVFPVNGVIPGWVEALQIMPVGSKWKLHIPSDLAYGQRGTDGIMPNSTLIFDIELLEIL